MRSALELTGRRATAEPPRKVVAQDMQIPVSAEYGHTHSDAPRHTHAGVIRQVANWVVASSSMPAFFLAPLTPPNK